MACAVEFVRMQQLGAQKSAVAVARSLFQQPPIRHQAGRGLASCDDVARLAESPSPPSQ